MHERGVGVIGDQSDPFLEGQVDRQGVVLGIDGFERLACVYLAALALGLSIQGAHRVPPAY